MLRPRVLDTGRRVGWERLDHRRTPRGARVPVAWQWTTSGRGVVHRATRTPPRDYRLARRYHRARWAILRGKLAELHRGSPCRLEVRGAVRAESVTVTVYVERSDGPDFRDVDCR